MASPYVPFLAERPKRRCQSLPQILCDMSSQGCAALTLGCLTLAAPSGLILRFINAVTDRIISYYVFFVGIIRNICEKKSGDKEKFEKNIMLSAVKNKDRSGCNQADSGGELPCDFFM